MIPSAMALLRQLDPLPYSLRNRTLGLLARDHAGDPGLEILAGDLLTGGEYERGLALMLARLAGAKALLLELLGDPVLRLRQSAARALVYRLEPSEAEELLSLDSVSRQAVIQALRRARRPEFADALLGPLARDFGPLPAAKLLPSCSAATVEQWLPRLVHRLSSYTVLTVRFPDLILRHLRDRLREVPEGLRSSVWWQHHGVVAPLVRSRPAELLQIMGEDAPAEIILTALRPHFGVLIEGHRGKVFEMLQMETVRQEWTRAGLPSQVAGKLGLFDQGQRLALAGPFADRPLMLVPLFRGLPPCQRATLFEQVVAALDTSAIRWPSALMAVLPHSVRARESARMLNLREVAQDTAETLRVYAFAHPEQAGEPLKALRTVPDAEQRAAAMVSRLQSAACYGCDLEGALSELERLRNEADPVRATVLRGLSEIPPSRLPVQALQRLLQVADWVIQARDTSSTTRLYLQKIAFRWLESSPVDSPAFQDALELLTTLVKGNPYLAFQADRLGPRRRDSLVRSLLPRIDEATARGDWTLALNLARGLGHYLIGQSELQSRLEVGTRKASDYEIRSLIGLWLYDPTSRDARVVELLRQEPSSIALSQVSEHLDSHRQDLLDPHLNGRPLRGRFSTADLAYIPPFGGNYAKWLPRQQKAMAELLLRVALDEGQHLSSRALALARISQLSSDVRPPMDVFLTDGDQGLRESALLSLDQEPQRLLPFLAKDEARVAATLVSKLVRRLPTAQAEELLSHALSSPMKMTSRKEMMRLLGEPRTPGSAALLLRAWKRPDMARDVRVAALHAATSLLDIEEVWTVLDEATSMGEPWLARQVIGVSPLAMAVEQRSRYLSMLLPLVKHSDRAVSQAAWLGLRAWLSVDRLAVASVASEGLASLENPDWRQSLNLWLKACRDGGADQQVRATFADVQALGVRPEAEADRDRPASQRLAAMVGALADLPRAFRSVLSPVVLEVADKLVDPLCRYRLRLASGVPVEQVCDTVGGYEELACLEMAVALEVRKDEFSPEHLLETAWRLAANPRKEIRRIALHCLAWAGPKLSWNESCRTLLLQLRADPESDVALQAQYRVYTHAE